MKRLFCVILSLLLMLPLCACNIADSDNIIGTWEATVPYGEVFNESLLQTYPSMTEYWKIEKFDLVMIYTFREDGTFKAEADRDALTESLKQLRIDLAVGYLRYMEDKGLLEDGINSANLTAIMEQMIGDDYYYAILIESEIRGNYKAEDGKLYATDDLSKQVDESSYEVIEFKGRDKLTIKSYSGEEEGGIASGFHPLVLERQ